MNEREIFTAALNKEDAAERAAFLAAACAGDAALRQRVESLLAEHLQLGSFMERPHGDAATIESPVRERPGTQIGPYKLLQQIGEGGMGVVFMAEQSQPVRRKVALKVIKPGMDTRQVIARFEAERQALAVMDHPNIAKVLDAGGTASGRPYFVMELVRGVPITSYCDQNKLSVRERLELFAAVCQAIQHAHTKGIIHRDIKPTNVLVTQQDGRPVVKVIDFGIAKAMGQQLTEKTLFTEFSQMVGTPLYMSPEQAELSSLDIDTRSDVYSLGVLLYELLTGTTPVGPEQMKKAAFDEIRRIIREDEPQRPSTRISSSETLPTIAAHRHIEPARLSKLLRGELDWIVMRALEKDRSRRYESASGFAADIERYLNDEAVHACPPSTWYRFRKFARRNKAALFTASALLAGLVVLVVGLALSNYWVIDERNEKTKALKERGIALDAARASAAKAEAESKRSKKNFLAARVAIRDVITKAAIGDGEWSNLPPPLRRKFSEESLNYYRGLLQTSSDPSDRYETAIAYRSIGMLHAYHGSGVEDFAKAEDCHRKSIALLDELATAYPAEIEYRYHLAESLRMLAGFLARRQRLPEADECYRKAVNLFQQLLAEVPTSGDYKSGLTNSLVQWQTVSGPRDPEAFENSLERADRLRVRQARAQSLAQTGRFEEAERVYRELAAEYETVAAESPDLPEYRYLQALSEFQLGYLLSRAGQTEDAENAFRKSITLLEGLSQEFPEERKYGQELGRAHNHLGFVLNGSARGDEAEQEHRQAITIYKSLAEQVDTRAGHWHRRELAWSRMHLSNLLVSTQRTTEAESELQSALELCAALAAEKPLDLSYPSWMSDIHGRLRRLYATTNRLDKAEQEVQRAIDMLEPYADPQLRLERANHYNDLAFLLYPARKLPEAETASRAAVGLKQALVTQFPQNFEYRYHLVHSILGQAYLAGEAGRMSDAVQAFGEAGSILDELAANASALATLRERLGHTFWQLADAWLRLERLEEAEQANQKALKSFEQLSTDNPANNFYRQEQGFSLRKLADIAERAGQLEDAERHLQQSVGLYDKLVTDVPTSAFYQQEAAHVRTRLAGLMLRSGVGTDTDAALLEAVRLKPELAPVVARQRLELARRLLNSGDFAAAEPAFDRTIALSEEMVARSPDDDSEASSDAKDGLAQALALRGVLLEKMERPEAATESYKRAIDLWQELSESSPDNEWYRQERAYFSLGLARLLEAAGELDEAIERCRTSVRLSEKLLADFPDHAQHSERLKSARGILIRLLCLTGLHEEAQVEADKVLQGQPSAEELNGIAWGIVTRPGAPVDMARSAAEMAQKAVELNPAAGHIWNTLGAAHYRAGNWKEAITALQKSSELRNGGDSADWFFLAMAHWQLGDKQEASLWHAKAVEWAEQHAKNNAEMDGFRAEAEALLNRE